MSNVNPKLTLEEIVRTLDTDGFNNIHLMWFGVQPYMTKTIHLKNELTLPDLFISVYNEPSTNSIYCTTGCYDLYSVGCNIYNTDDNLPDFISNIFKIVDINKEIECSPENVLMQLSNCFKKYM